MTPAARLSAAIRILDAILDGAAAEQALTNWARSSRFAGSGDRAAVRDHVFDALRCRGSYGALGGGASGRALIVGLVRAQGLDAAAIFTGDGHAPETLSPSEAALIATPLPAPEALAPLDWPEWIRPRLEADLGGDFLTVSRQMQARAPVFLRVNIARITRDVAAAELLAEGIGTRAHPLAETVLEVISGARKIHQSATYAEGLVELQDAACQAAVALVPIREGDRVLDFCAGGGGKALALAAAEPRAKITAHDIDPARMRDLPVRAARAGARIAVAKPGQAGEGYDLVLVDAPCTGSGTWRRAPDAKWRLAPARLEALVALQGEILDEAATKVHPGGHLVYMTCSLFEAENQARQAQFAARSGWESVVAQRWTPVDGADGFFIAVFRRQDSVAKT